MSSNFNVKFLFNTGWYDITTKVRVKDMYKERYLYKSLKPTIDVCKFKIQYDQTILSKLLLSDYDIPAIILKDGQPYFKGVVKPSYTMKSSSRVEWVDVQINDNSYLLDKTINRNIQKSDAYLCNSDVVTAATEVGTEGSLLHLILYYAGYDDTVWSGDLYASTDISDVSNTLVELNYFTHRKSEPTDDNTTLDKIPYGGSYRELLTNLLFQYGYTYYFNDAGVIQLFNFKDTNIDPESNVVNNTNMLGTLTVKKNEPTYDAVEISWYGQETLNDQLLFVDDGGTSSAAYPNGNIPIEVDGYYPTSANATDYPEGYYDINFEDGRSTEDIVAIDDPDLDIEYYGYDLLVEASHQELSDKTKVVEKYGWKKVDSYTMYTWFKIKPNFVNGKTIRAEYDGYHCRGFLCYKDGYRWIISAWVWTVVSTEIVNAGEYETIDDSYTVYKEEAYTQEFTSKPLSFQLRIHNTSPDYVMYIRKLHIRGDIILRSNLNITRDEYSAATEKMFKYKAAYIYYDADADRFSNSLYNYFQQSSYQYTVKCTADYQPGDWVLLTDNNFQNVDGFPVENKRCLVVTRKDNDFTDSKTYTLEQYVDYEE